MTDIQPPDAETRMGIVKAKAADKGFDLPDDVAALLAERAHDDIRELEGLLSRVLTHARLTDVPATLDHALEALTALPPASASTPDANHLLHAVSAYFAISIEALAGKSRPGLLLKLVTPQCTSYGKTGSWVSSRLGFFWDNGTTRRLYTA